MKVLDTNRNTMGHYDRLRAAGYDRLIRYLSRFETDKVVTVAEAKAIAAAGMRLGLVYETNGKPSGAQMGAADGAYARQAAARVGAPAGAIIWYTVDYDAGPAELPGVEAAFAAFKAALGDQYRVGAYASGWVCDEIYAKGLCVARWLTDSGGFRGTRESRLAGRYELMQALPANVAGLDTDPDAVHMTAEGVDADIGDFVPFAGAAQAAGAPPAAPPVEAPPQPAASRPPAPDLEPVVDRPKAEPVVVAQPQLRPEATEPPFSPPDHNATDT